MQTTPVDLGDLALVFLEKVEMVIRQGVRKIADVLADTLLPVSRLS